MATRWKTLVDDAVMDAPRTPACYAIYLDGRLHYVGSTENMKARFYPYFDVARYSASFVTPWGYYASVMVKYRPTRKFGDWLMIEARLLRRVSPPGNTRGTGKKRAAKLVTG